RYRLTVPAEEMSDDGLYIIADVEHATHVRYNGGYSMLMILKNEQFGERPFFARLEVDPARVIRGRLLRPDGSAAADVLVTGFSQSSLPSSSRTGAFMRARTNAKGEFELRAHKSGIGLVWCRPADQSPLRAPFGPNEVDLGVLKLKPGMRVI